jgi:hypothetical protein
LTRSRCAAMSAARAEGRPAPQIDRAKRAALRLRKIIRHASRSKLLPTSAFLTSELRQRSPLSRDRRPRRCLATHPLPGRAPASLRAASAGAMTPSFGEHRAPPPGPAPAAEPRRLASRRSHPARSPTSRGAPVRLRRRSGRPPGRSPHGLRSIGRTGSPDSCAVPQAGCSAMRAWC